MKAIVLAGPDPAVDNTRRGASSICAGGSRSVGGVRDSETGMLRVLWSLDYRTGRPDRAARRAARRPSKPLKRGLAARLTEIAQAHPEAERLEIWSQDEASASE